MNGKEPNALIQQIETSKNLPSLPHILLKVIEICNREESNFSELEEIIEKDPALSSKILSLVNSTQYSLPNTIGSLDQAIRLIGMDAVKNSALCASIHQVFSPLRGSSHFHLKRFWRHSLLCALVSRSIAAKAGCDNPEEAFLAGLLHDIGKLVLLMNFPKPYAHILNSAKESLEILLSEELKLGALHSEVGGWLIGKWNLRSLLADAVLYHHEPVYRIIDASSLVRIVYVANAISMQGDEGGENRFGIARTVLGFQQNEVEGIIRSAEGEVTKIAGSLEIEIDEIKEDSSIDKSKQDALHHEIKNISLLLGTLQNIIKAHTDESIISMLHQSMRILFGFKNATFFQFDHERNILVSRHSAKRGEAGPFDKLFIACEREKSMVVQTLFQNLILYSFSHFEKHPLTILDEQIIRFLGKEGIAAFPLIANGVRIGVFIVGIDNAQLSHVVKREKFLKLVLNQVAFALYADQLGKSQSKVVQTERIEASSSTALRIAHEANNPLGIIRNYLSILDEKLKSRDIVFDEMRTIAEEIDRISRLLDELSEMAEPKMESLESVDVNKSISDLLALYAKSTFQKSHIQVHKNFDYSLLPVSIQHDNFKQIFENIIKNAAEAMHNGGNITVTTKYIRSAPQEKVSRFSDKPDRDKGYIEIGIADDGPGIPENLRLKLFEPLVSSKGGKHRGVGLSIVYNLVKKMKGAISCKSSQEKGTTFTLFFPV